MTGSKNEAVQVLGGLSIVAGILALINEAIGGNTSQEYNLLPTNKY